MSLSPDISTPTASDIAGSDPTADAGATTQGTQPAAPAAPAGRTYSQSEFDNHTAGLRRSEQARYDRQLAIDRDRIRAELANPQGTVDHVAREVGTLRTQMSKFQLDSAVANVSKRYGNFNEAAVLQLIVDRGLDRLDAPYEDILDTAYRIWNHDTLAAKPPVDVEAIRKAAKDEALKEYQATKTSTAAATPRVEGAGGSAPTSSDARSKLRTRKGALDAAVERITKSQATA